MKILGVAARSTASARRFAAAHDLRAYLSIDDMLADPGVDLVVNLTLPKVHAKITHQCLSAGKHVYSEKPLAFDRASARRIAALAKRSGLRLGSAPATFLGEAHQTAARIVRRGLIGRVRVIYAEVNHGRIERYHPAPEPFFSIGPMWDVGVYPITAITAVFGPVVSVRAWGRVVLARRLGKGGHMFRIASPDFIVAWLELTSGPVVRLTANFYVDRDHSKGGGSLEYHGDDGRIYIGDFQRFDAPVELSLGSQPYTRMPLARPAFAGVEFGRGVSEMVDSIRSHRPHRATAAQAVHVVDVVEAIERSLSEDGTEVRVRSDFTLPAPMPWAL